ncbi:MAG: TIGR02147 family protein [Myxococcales bacterium]|nr:TIGR02147 family protein [Myxococcales bacterium]
MVSPPSIDVFDYLDVRTYLHDAYLAKKKEGRGFSFRSFARRVGLKSPNHLKRVIDGERTLTPDMARRYAEALGLREDAATYFCDLAAYGRATTDAERDEAYGRLAGHRHYRRANLLQEQHAAYHERWYLPAIREMVLQSDFQRDPIWIAEQLVPSISPEEAEDALRVLLSLGLLRDEAGELTQGEAVVTTGPETEGQHIRSYHRTMMERATASMDDVPAELRDISSLTFCAGSASLAELKERVRRFRQEVIALAASESEGEQVVQLNIQLFPLTMRPKG